MRVAGALWGGEYRTRSRDSQSMRLPFLLITLPLYAADQITKWLVVRHIPQFSPIEVVPGFFNLVHTYNTGMAFGLMKNNNVFFVGLSIVVATGLLIFAWRGAFRGALPQLGVWLLLAGIFGNLTDRLVHGHVIDFLEFYVVAGSRVFAWPAFNLADSCICVAAGLFVLSAFLARDEETVTGQDSKDASGEAQS